MSRSDEAGLRDLIASFLAGDVPGERLHVDTGAVADDLDDAEIFVEVKGVQVPQGGRTSEWEHAKLGM